MTLHGLGYLVIERRSRRKSIGKAGFMLMATVSTLLAPISAAKSILYAKYATSNITKSAVVFMTSLLHRQRQRVTLTPPTSSGILT